MLQQDETKLGRFIERGDRVRWICDVCGAIRDVDLQAMLSAAGPDYTLANRRPSCPLCPGRVRLVLWPGLWPVSIDTITDRDAAWWDFQEQEKQRLDSLGWTLRMGHWHNPDGVPAWSLRCKTPPA